MAQVAELRHWQHHYYSLVVRWGMKLCFPRPVDGREPTCDGAHSWRLYSAVSLEHQELHPVLLSYSVTLSWYWANQSLPYLNNDERQAREQKVLIGLTRPGFEKWQGPHLNVRPSNCSISQSGRYTLYTFGHPDCLCEMSVLDTVLAVHRKRAPLTARHSTATSCSLPT